MKCFGYLDSGYITMAPQKKKKKIYENLCQVSVENTSARSPFLCHVTDLVFEQYFTFSLQIFILLWEIRTTAAHQTLNHMGGMCLLCRKGNIMRAITDQLQVTNMIRANKQCISLWSRAQILLMNKSISNSVAKWKLIKW